MLIDQETYLAVQLCTDTKDVYLALQRTRPYRGADHSVGLYVEVRSSNSILFRAVLVDSKTKNMKGVLLRRLIKTGEWSVTACEIYRYIDTCRIRATRIDDNDKTNCCFMDGCACLHSFSEKQHSSPSCWWKLPVVSLT